MLYIDQLQKLNLDVYKAITILASNYQSELKELTVWTISGQGLLAKIDWT
jgi:hypothetical protein